MTRIRADEDAAPHAAAHPPGGRGAPDGARPAARPLDPAVDPTPPSRSRRDRRRSAHRPARPPRRPARPEPRSPDRPRQSYGGGQPAVQGGRAVADLADLDVLVRRVRQLRVAGPVVQRRDAQRGEPRHVGPAELRGRLGADRGEELAGRRRRQPGQRAGRRVGQLDVETRRTPPARAPSACCSRAVRGEPEVDLDLARVRDHVAGDPAGDPDRVQALAVRAAVDGDRPRAGSRRAGAAPRRRRGSR